MRRLLAAVARAIGARPTAPRPCDSCAERAEREDPHDVEKWGMKAIPRPER